VCVTGAVLYFGGLECIDGSLSSGSLVSFLLYQSTLTDNLNSMTSVYGGLMTAIGAAEKVFQWIDRQPAIVDDGKLAPAACSGRIQFQNVSVDIIVM
jgi:ATP-binding cassette, subfamily B (MDR/TAP), member 9